MNTNVENTLRGWEVSLSRYGHIDSWNVNEKVNYIGEYIKTSEDSLIIKRLVRKIRDLVIIHSDNITLTLDLIQNALSKIYEMKGGTIDSSCNRVTPGQRERFNKTII